MVSMRRPLLSACYRFFPKKNFPISGPKRPDERLNTKCPNKTAKTKFLNFSAT